MLIGGYIHIPLEMMGWKTKKRGLYYYAEVHQKELNIAIHIIGMPWTVYGILLWLPALFQLARWNAHIMQVCLFIGYMTHYSRVNIDDALFASIMYAPSLYGAMEHYSYVAPFQSFTYGFIVSFVALFLQEVLGHSLSGDPQSRLEAVPNAILYAILFSARSLRKRVLRLVTCVRTGCGRKWWRF